MLKIIKFLIKLFYFFIKIQLFIFATRRFKEILLKNPKEHFYYLFEYILKKKLFKKKTIQKPISRIEFFNITNNKDCIQNNQRLIALEV